MKYLYIAWPIKTSVSMLLSHNNTCVCYSSGTIGDMIKGRRGLVGEKLAMAFPGNLHAMFTLLWLLDAWQICVHGLNGQSCFNHSCNENPFQNMAKQGWDYKKKRNKLGGGSRNFSGTNPRRRTVGLFSHNPKWKLLEGEKWTTNHSHTKYPKPLKQP